MAHTRQARGAWAGPEPGAEASGVRGTVDHAYATSRERRLAIAISLSAAAIVVAIIPEAGKAVGVAPAFVPAVMSGTVVALFLTAWVLWMQFRVERHAPLLLLGAAYAGSALLIVLYVLLFPGVFSLPAFMGGGPQSAVWLYVAWHAVYIVLIIAYVVLEHRVESGKTSRTKALRSAAVALVATTLAIAGIAFLATRGHASLPVLISGTHVMPLYRAVILPVLVALNIGALYLSLRWFRARTLGHLWLGVVIFISTMELIVAGWVVDHRYSLGWYLARTELVLWSTVLLMALEGQTARILWSRAREGDRIRRLCMLASTDATPETQVEAALRLGMDVLRAPWAYLSSVAGDHVTVQLGFGAIPVKTGHAMPLSETIVRHAFAHGRIFSIDDTKAPPWRDDPVAAASVARRFVAIPLTVGGALYGAAGFGSDAPGRPLRETDRNFLVLLGALIESSLERSRRKAELSALAFHDMLTGLPNRALLTDRLDRLVTAADRGGASFALHYMDLDGFKSINDDSGHAAGDEALRQVAARLLRAVRETDTVARVGGDEFVVLQTDVATTRDAERFARRLNDAFDERFAIHGLATRRLTVSVGTSVFSVHGDTKEALLGRADADLYARRHRRLAAASATNGGGPPPVVETKAAAAGIDTYPLTRL